MEEDAVLDAEDVTLCREAFGRKDKKDKGNVCKKVLLSACVHAAYTSESPPLLRPPPSCWGFRLPPGPGLRILERSRFLPTPKVDAGPKAQPASAKAAGLPPGLLRLSSRPPFEAFFLSFFLCLRRTTNGLTHARAHK